MKFRCIGAVISFFWVISFAQGQTCCSGGVPLANNVGGLPTVDSGTIQLSAQWDVNILNTLKDENETLDDDSRSRKTWSGLLHAGLSFTDRMSVEGLFSWVRQERFIQQAGGYEDFAVSQGIGDAVVLAHYQWWKKDRLRIVGGAGFKAPFGSTDQENDVGIALSADLQPGTGAWDIILLHKIEWLQMGGSLFNLAGNIVYRITGTNDHYLKDQKYRFGNELQIMGGVARQLLLFNQLVDGQIGFRYRTTSVDLINGEMLANTGGHWLFANLGGVWQLSQKASVSFAVDLPIYSYVSGTQLSPTIRITIGGYYLINKTGES